jgi:hypothetical protein
MKRLMMALACMLLLSSCLSFEFPHVVRDTVNAGKDVMGMSDTKGIVFTNTVVSEPTDAADVLTGQCLRELETQARDKLGKRQLAYRVISKDVSMKGDKLVATCSLEII